MCTAVGGEESVEGEEESMVSRGRVPSCSPPGHCFAAEITTVHLCASLLPERLTVPSAAPSDVVSRLGNTQHRLQIRVFVLPRLTAHRLENCRGCSAEQRPIVYERRQTGHT